MRHPIRIQNLGGASAVILHRPHPTVQALERQLRAIGLAVAQVWPELGPEALGADFVFFDADMGHDEQFPWMPGKSPMPMVALVGSEAPGRIEWALRAGAHAQLLKPVGDNGVYSALLIARDAFDAQRALAVEIADLRRRLDERQTVVRAVTLLAAQGAKDDAAAYGQLRQMAMAWRVSFEDAAARVVARYAAGQGKMIDATVDSVAPTGALRRLMRRKLALFGLALIALVVAGAVLAPWIAPYAPDDQMFDGLTIEGSPLPPDGRFLFGTDLLGRDLLSRILYGAQTSLIIGVVANGMALLIGTLVGITAGYFRGWIGAVLMRFTDLMMAFPALLLAICLAAIFQPSLWIVALVIALVNWVQTARVIYTETTSLATRDFIAAERTLGAGTGRILFRHILPHLVPTIIVWGTLGISTTVLLEATLSFLGVGVQPPVPSWGNIIFENQTYFQSAPWLVFIPGAAIILLALAFNLVGDALRDVLDPTQRGRD